MHNLRQGDLTREPVFSTVIFWPAELEKSTMMSARSPGEDSYIGKEWNGFIKVVVIGPDLVNQCVAKDNL